MNSRLGEKDADRPSQAGQDHAGGACRDCGQQRAGGSAALGNTLLARPSRTPCQKNVLGS